MFVTQIPSKLIVFFKITTGISVKATSHEKSLNDLQNGVNQMQTKIDDPGKSQMLNLQTPSGVNKPPIQSTIHPLNATTSALKQQAGTQRNELLKDIKGSEKEQTLKVTQQQNKPFAEKAADLLSSLDDLEKDVKDLDAYINGNNMLLSNKSDAKDKLNDIEVK
jgi:hypothetical protein